MDQCIIMSVKTSNSQSEIEKMEFFKFRALTRSLNKYIESENKQQNGSSSEEDLSTQSNNMMNNAKNMMGNIKAPKIKSPKIK